MSPTSAEDNQADEPGQEDFEKLAPDSSAVDPSEVDGDELNDPDPNVEDDTDFQDGNLGTDDSADDPAPPRTFEGLAALDLSGILNLPDFSKLVLPEVPNFAPNLPKLDFLKDVIPALDFSGLLPTTDFASIFPKIELALPSIEWAATLPKIDLPKFGPAFSRLLENLRKSLPPNWPTEVDIDQVVKIIQDDGIPLVWVPREAIVSEVLAAADRVARVGVLVSHSGELVEDCRGVLGAIRSEALAGQVPLATKVLDAFEAGHHEAAQALAVVVTETAVARAISDKYHDVKKQVLFDPDLVPYTQLRLRAALAPIGSFYTTWRLNSGTPAPEALSRHVAVHQADHRHYTKGNAVVSILLVASVLRALQELQDLAEASEEQD